MKTQNRWRYLSLCLFNSTAGAAFGQSRDGEGSGDAWGHSGEERTRKYIWRKGRNINKNTTSSSEEYLNSERFPASRTCCSIYQALICIDVRQCEPELCSLYQQDSSDADVPLDGAQARLEILKDNLLKREREISMLMEGQERVTDPVEQSAYARLLNAVIQQVYMSKNKFENIT